MRKRAMGRVDYEKKTDGVRVYHKRKSDGVKDEHKIKSDGVRVDYEKDRWSENSPLERAMG